MYRGRRLRKHQVIRSMMQETRLHKADLIYPIFVVEGSQIKEEISSMPDVYHYSIDRLHEVLDEMKACGIHSCILFGIPEHKDEVGSVAYQQDGIVQRAISFIKEYAPEMYVIGDVCMCEYTSHGHCGILNEAHDVDNDATLPYLNQIAISYAKAGVDMVAPSDMMDGHIQSMRQALDEAGFTDLPIMGYSAKFASSYYGPFREAADSAPCFGDRKSYQMDIANGEEAQREIDADIMEGADIIMVKPALSYLDVVARAKDRLRMPLCVYNVSGEYSMLLHAVHSGLMKEEVIYESILSMKRAGADLIITYFALYLARLLDERGVA
ncbi:porphobilinogen synthase [[Eubacterium] hominis]|uniref:porphobilinogen synthase n=1 Tax=[Eubacterium] hominis TaxID=2764325 RepID=UPI003A4E13FD